MKQNPSSQQSWREMLVEYSLDAVVGIDCESNVIDWNFQAEQIFGWSKAEVLGKKISSLIIPPEFREAHHAGIRYYLESGVAPILNKRIELAAMNSAGNRFPIELTVSPIKVDGEVFFYSFVRDISERKAMENALKDHITQKDEFIRICSHELKTPISSMKLQFQMTKHLMDRNDPKAYDKEYIDKRIVNANLQLNKMSKLIEDMLHATEISSGALEMDRSLVELNELTSNALINFEDQLDMLKIHMSFVKSNTPVMVFGDRYRLEQVISNLVTNAIKYGSDKPLQIKIDTKEKEARLTILDQGLGIPKEHLSKIFNRYERVPGNPQINGLGLGLYICDQIVKAHSGKIVVESQLGEGSKFVLVLPLMD